MVNEFVTRRAVLAASVLIAGSAALPAFALSDSQATSLVNKMSDDIVRTINSGQSESAMFRDFERLLKTYADMPTISRFALGPAARTASSSELSAYSNAFASYLSRKYGQRFRDFIGGKLEVRGTRSDSRAVIVQARALVPGQSPVAVEFHVSDRSGSAKVFNVIIEGINLLTTERTEIQALLDRQGGSVSKLTSALKQAS